MLSLDEHDGKCNAADWTWLCPDQIVIYWTCWSTPRTKQQTVTTQEDITVESEVGRWCFFFFSKSPSPLPFLKDRDIKHHIMYWEWMFVRDIGTGAKLSNNRAVVQITNCKWIYLLLNFFCPWAPQTYRLCFLLKRRPDNNYWKVKERQECISIYIWKNTYFGRSNTHVSYPASQNEKPLRTMNNENKSNDNVQLGSSAISACYCLPELLPMSPWNCCALERLMISASRMLSPLSSGYSCTHTYIHHTHFFSEWFYCSCCRCPGCWNRARFNMRVIPTVWNINTASYQ